MAKMAVDMKEEDSFGFEGFEKRLEVEFEHEASDSGGLSSDAGLRSLSRCKLDEMLSAAECTIVSEIHNKWFDAYVLSESSLFVYPHRLVLKTCGKTQLLNAVPVLLHHASTLSLQAVHCKYSRGTFIFPLAQPFPHTSFAEETRVLDELFAPLLVHGCRSAHVLDGDPDSDSTSWHIYTATGAKEHAPFPNLQSVSMAMTEGNCVKTSLDTAMAAGEGVKTFPDRATATGGCVKTSLSSPVQSRRKLYTLEMCMTHLHPSTASHFMNLSGVKSGADMTHDAGISSLLRSAVICDYAFTPCGYSMNGMEEDALSTIHVTPEEGHSYASFEVMGYDPHLLDLGALVNRVVACFKPGSLVMSIHATRDGQGSFERMASSWDTSNLVPQGYICNSSVRQELSGHGVVVFRTFTESPFAERRSVIPQPLCHHDNQATKGAGFASYELSAAFGDDDYDGDGGGLVMPWSPQNGRSHSLLELKDSTLERVSEGSLAAQAELTCPPYDHFAGGVAYAREALETYQSSSNSYELIDDCGAVLTIVDSETELFQLQECYPNAKVILRLRPKGMGFDAELSPNAGELLRESKKMDLQVVGIAVDTGMESKMTLCIQRGGHKGGDHGVWECTSSQIACNGELLINKSIM